MDKNLLWAVTLSIAVYGLWFGLIEKRYVKPAAQQRAAAAAQQPGTDRRPEAALASAPAAGVTAPEGAAAVDRKLVESEADTLATPSAQLRIHPRGAAVVSCLYHSSMGDVELVHDASPGLFATWPGLVFARQPAEGGAARYAAARPDGMKILKEFLPGGPDALPRLRIRLSNPTAKPLATGDWAITLGPGLDTVPTEKKENTGVWRALGLRPDDKGAPGKLEVLKPGPHDGPFLWAGVDNRYFLAAALGKPEDFSGAETSLPPHVALKAKSFVLAPGEERAWDVPYYLGAKGYTGLRRYQLGLDRSVDFGWFKDVGRPILRLLGWLQARTGNWGWSIVLMTFLIQALLLPLTLKSMKAMAVMKKLQPDIARLQQKYSKEPARLNQEMMALYKQSGANPLGGCLPLMLQMPVFIALFNALRNAWELHGAPWVFWVHDLSAKDPFYVLPVVMGVVMFLQNRMNPAATSDPTQKTMMTWMPVIFTFMFLSTPAGLVLYWLTSSIISASIQVALKRHFESA